MAARAPSLRTILHTARSATGGAPRLYRAARQSGASSREAAAVVATSAAALLVAARRAPGRPGRQNAVRHFTWQAVLTARHGRVVASAVADAQERGSVRLRDTAVDQRNNAAGQTWGHAHEQQLSGGTLLGALERASTAALSMWDAGELAR
jgi:antirestriction protein ArdC